MEIRLEDILRLSVPERIELVEAILRSIREEAKASVLTGAQRLDLEARMEEYARNPDDTVSWEAVKEAIDRSG